MASTAAIRLVYSPQRGLIDIDAAQSIISNEEERDDYCIKDMSKNKEKHQTPNNTTNPPKKRHGMAINMRTKFKLSNTDRKSSKQAATSTYIQQKKAKYARRKAQLEAKKVDYARKRLEVAVRRVEAAMADQRQAEGKALIGTTTKDAVHATYPECDESSQLKHTNEIVLCMLSELTTHDVPGRKNDHVVEQRDDNDNEVSNIDTCRDVNLSRNRRRQNVTTKSKQRAAKKNCPVMHFYQAIKLKKQQIPVCCMMTLQM